MLLLLLLLLLRSRVNLTPAAALSSPVREEVPGSSRSKTDSKPRAHEPAPGTGVRVAA